MASVGAVTCSLVKGTSRGLVQRVETWHVPGLGGQAGLLLGFSEGEFSYRAMLYESKANVLTWYTALQLLQGTVVTITDDWGASSTNCLITRVGELLRSPATANGITGADCRGEVTVEGVKVGA